MWLELDGLGPLHQQVYRSLRRSILEGALRPGDRLPATRGLAREAGVSRNTLLQAYEQLGDEGYLVARTGSGTYVAASLPDDQLAVGGRGGVPAKASSGRRGDASEPLTVSRYAARILEAAPRAGVSWGMPRRRLPYDFRYGEPAYGDLPLDTRGRLHGRRARRASESRLAYGEPTGAPELRRALCGYLSRARGVTCTPDQILITRGAQQAIDLVATPASRSHSAPTGPSSYPSTSTSTACGLRSSRRAHASEECA